MAKLSINALVGLFARNLDLVYSMRTSNHQVDGEGCSWRQTFTDAAGRMHWDHVFVAELLSNSSYRPVHDFIMGAEYTAMARVRRALAEVPKRYLKCLKTDCLVMQDVPKKHRSAIERLLRLSHRDGTPVYRCEPTEGLRGQYREPRMQAEPIREKPAWRRVEDPLTHCLGGESLLLTGYPGTGKTHLARKIVEARPCGSSGTPSTSSRRPTPPSRMWGSGRRRRITGCAATFAAAAAAPPGWSSKNSLS